MSSGGRSPTVAPLGVAHRGAVEEIVRATGMFHEAEVGVALELFDEAHGAGALESRGAGGGQQRRGLPDSDYEFLGLFDQSQRLLGYVCFGPTPGTDRGYDLYWIAVAPAAQNTGGGSMLLAEVERRLKERNARLVLAETSSRGEYAPTRAFYAKRGYRESARVRDFYGPGDDRLLFTKRLQPAPRIRGSRPEEAP